MKFLCFFIIVSYGFYVFLEIILLIFQSLNLDENREGCQRNREVERSLVGCPQLGHQ